MKIHILGTGYPKCHQLAENAKSAIEQASIEAELENVTEINKIFFLCEVQAFLKTPIYDFNIF